MIFTRKGVGLVASSTGRLSGTMRSVGMTGRSPSPSILEKSDSGILLPPKASERGGYLGYKIVTHDTGTIRQCLNGSYLAQESGHFFLCCCRRIPEGACASVLSGSIPIASLISKTKRPFNSGIIELKVLLYELS